MHHRSLVILSVTLMAMLSGNLDLRAAEVAPAPAPTPLVPTAQAPAAQVPGAQAPVAQTPGAPSPVAEAPLKTLPADVRLRLRLADGGRTDTRWAASPFPTLFSTAWGKGVAEQVRSQPGPFQLLAQLAPAQQATLALTVADEQPTGHLLARARDEATGAALVTTLNARPATTVIEGLEVRATLPLITARLDSIFKPRAPGLNNGMRWSWSELLPLSTADLATAINPLVDADLQWRNAAPWPGAAPEATLGVRAEWQLTSYGMHELVRISGVPKPTSTGGAPATVDRTVFTGLPADTVWALSSAPLPVVLEQIPGLTSEVIDAWARKQDLPSWTTLKPQLGSALIWLQQGVPLPALSIEVHMPQEAGLAALAWLDAKHQFSPGADGTHIGAMGFIPVQAAWQTGSLIITTGAGGIAGAVARPSGFATDPAVADALKALPTGDLLLAGVSRSGESWGGLAAFAPWLTRRKPELASLSTDLRKAGTYGFVSLRRDQELIVIDAGGLFGGPLSTTAILGGFFRAVVGDRQGGMGGPGDRQRPARQRARDASKPDEPGDVKPKQVEF